MNMRGPPYGSSSQYDPPSINRYTHKDKGDDVGEEDGGEEEEEEEARPLFLDPKKGGPPGPTPYISTLITWSYFNVNLVSYNIVRVKFNPNNLTCL